MTVLPNGLVGAAICQQLYAFNISTGAIVWIASASAAVPFMPMTPPSMRPDGVTFAVLSIGTMGVAGYAISIYTLDGQLLSTFVLPGTYFFIMSPITVDANDTAFVLTFDSVHAVNLSSGSITWQLPLPEAVSIAVTCVCDVLRHASTVAPFRSQWADSTTPHLS